MKSIKRNIDNLINDIVVEAYDRTLAIHADKKIALINDLRKKKNLATFWIKVLLKPLNIILNFTLNFNSGRTAGF